MNAATRKYAPALHRIEWQRTGRRYVLEERHFADWKPTAQPGGIRLLWLGIPESTYVLPAADAPTKANIAGLYGPKTGLHYRLYQDVVRHWCVEVIPVPGGMARRNDALARWVRAAIKQEVNGYFRRTTTGFKEVTFVYSGSIGWRTGDPPVRSRQGVQTALAEVMAVDAILDVILTQAKERFK